MNLIDHSKSILENLYYLSGILILVTDYIGLIQISLTKKALRISSQREAALLAVKQIDLYTSVIMPLIDQITFLKHEKRINHYNINEFNNNVLVNKVGEGEYKKILQRTLIFLDKIVPALNAMDAFSVYFVKAIADEQIAFSCIGETFIKSVEALYADISIACGNEKNKSYINLLILYDIWNKRIKKEKLEEDQKNLINELKSIKTKNITPIGTK